MKKKIANPQLGGMQDDLVSQSGDDAAAQVKGRPSTVYNFVESSHVIERSWNIQHYNQDADASS